MKRGETVFFGVCVAFFGFFLFQALRLAGEGRPGEIGSGLWPGIASGASFFLSVALLVTNLRKVPKGPGHAAEPASEAIAERRKRRGTVTLSTACFLAYMVVIPFLGFILATLFFIPAFALSLGERRKKVLLVAPFLLTAVIVAVFIKFITIPFPKGEGIFAAFSRIFY